MTIQKYFVIMLNIFYLCFNCKNVMDKSIITMCYVVKNNCIDKLHDDIVIDNSSILLLKELIGN